jgi:hypothetical protein
VPQHREQFQVGTTIDGAMQAVGAALGGLRADGWQRLDPSTACLQCQEAMSLLSFHNPVTVQVTLTVSGSVVSVALDGTNPGFGPIQARHVQGVVTEFRARIESAAARAGEAPAASQPTLTADHGVPPPPPPAPVSKLGEHRVFVSYRRDDSGHVTDRICDGLAARLGGEAIFKDIDDIPLGVNFKRFIRDRIERCDVLLAVIGRDWLGKGPEPGRSRLEDPSDYVRIEVEAALARQIPVIPVLIRAASVPPADSLPETLQELPNMNGIEIRRGHDFDNDLARLVDQLERLLAR